MTDKNIEMAHKIATAVQQEGGRTYFVGGYVRDLLLGRDNKDIDIEVHGISVQNLERILDALGERLTMGASFGIMGLRHYDLDIAMPRSETATGRGHKDFEIFVDPFIGEEKAASRRDFTMNALMQDVLTGEILDFFGGKKDILHRRIRHVNETTFIEDPLRVLRAAQFAARFGFEVAEETVALSSGMDLTVLPGERIFLELEKVLQKALRPSVFFEELRQMNQLSVWFPELENLIGVLQNEQYHPEGDVWVHTMQVLDEAANLRKDVSEPLWFMLSALAHDFGKQIMTFQDGETYHAYKHEKEGIPIVQKFLRRITKEVKLNNYVLNMTELHMEPNQKARDGARVKSFMKMFDRSVNPKDLIFLAKADYLGRIGKKTDRSTLISEYEVISHKLNEMLQVYEDRMSRPYLMGRDLIEAGVLPGPVFTYALEYAHKLRLAGVSKEEQLSQTLGMIRERIRNED